MKNDLDRLVPKFEISEAGCWIWTAAVDRSGYGRFRFQGRNDMAYRVAYRLAVGPIPAGTELDHLCRVPLCINPDHLEPVSKSLNLIRANTGTLDGSQCKRGHPFTPENTAIRQGVRVCRPCKRLGDRRYKARKKAGIS